MNHIPGIGKLIFSIFCTAREHSEASQFHMRVQPLFFSDMRRDVQDIFRATPHEKQVMMFSATLSKDIRPICKKFMQDVIMLSTPIAPCRSTHFSGG